MAWRLCKNGGSGKIRNFLGQWEWKNLHLSRDYRQAEKIPLAPLGEGSFMAAWYAPENSGELKGLLYGRGGMILPLLAEGLSASEVFGTPLPFPLGSPRAVMGEAAAVKSLEAQIDRPKGETVDYDLMVRIGGGGGTVRSLPDIEIRRAKPSDSQALFPLQKAYVFEEVLFENSLFNPRLCLKRLKHSLKNGTVLVACHRGVPLAKAETNARGYTFSQVGGVYTLPSHRKRGIARCLMDELARREWKNQRGLVLFVKKTNRPAQGLYRNGGFRRVGDFRISYYQR